YFPSRGFEEESIRSYNKAVGDCIDGVREFLTLHYVASSRDDTPFWKATKHECFVPDALQERLRLWEDRLPTDRTINPNFHGFTAYSYSTMLLGLGSGPKHSLAALDYVPDDLALAAFEQIRKRSAHLANTLPHVYDYLRARYEKEVTPAFEGAAVTT